MSRKKPGPKTIFDFAVCEICPPSGAYRRLIRAKSICNGLGCQGQVPLGQGVVDPETIVDGPIDRPMDVSGIFDILNRGK